MRAPGVTSPGTDLTVETVRRLRRPLLVTEGDVAEVERWLSGLGSELTLNVAGPRESEQPGLYDLTWSLIDALIGRVTSSESGTEGG